MSVYEEAGSQWGIDPALLRAMEMQESGGNVNATSKTGAQGNMQFMPSTARAVGVANTRVPAFSVPSAAKLIRQLLDGPAKGDITTALRMYHGGEDRSKWGPVNAAYAPAVFGNLKKAQMPPPTAPAAFNPATMSDAELAAHLDEEARGAPAQTAAPAKAAPATLAPVPFNPATMSDAELAAHLDQEAAGGSEAQIAAAPETKLRIGHIGFTPDERKAYDAGIEQSTRDIGTTLHRAAGWVGRNIPGVETAYSAVGYDPASAVSRLDQERAQFNQQYGNSGDASFGRGVGQTTATLPIMGVANPLISTGARAGANALSSISPELAATVGKGLTFLGGEAGAASLPTRIASQTASGAIQGGEAAAINSGQSDAPIAQQVKEGALTGGLIGAAAPVAQGVTRAVSGAAANIPQDVAKIAQLARDNYGIQLKPAQLGLNPALGYANSALKMIPGSGAGASEAATRDQWINAVAKTIDPSASVSRITPEFISTQQRRIGGVLEDIENGARVNLDGGFLNDAARIEANAQSSLTDQEFGVVRRQLDNVMKNVDSAGDITGQTYGNLIHKGSALDSALSSTNANVRNYASQIRDALRDSLQRSITPEEAEAYRTARTQYKNLKTVEPLTTRADTQGGPRPSVGDISPAALQAAVTSSYGRTSYARAGHGDIPLIDLARIGQFMKEPPNPGSHMRTSMLGLGVKAAELAGLAATGHYAGIGPAAAALGAGWAGGRLANSYLSSPALANRMIDRSLNPAAAAAANPLMLPQWTIPLAITAGRSGK